MGYDAMRCVLLSKSKAHSGLRLISRADTLLNTKCSYVIFSIKSFAFSNAKYPVGTGGSVSTFLSGSFVEPNEEEQRTPGKKLRNKKRMCLFSVRL